MKTKFNKFERVAGMFVLTALFGGVAATISVAYKKGWFSTKVPLEAVFDSADGIRVGTVVRMAGLRAGSVTRVTLEKDNTIHVRFVLLKKFFQKVKKDSAVKMVRPFVIGEKVMQVTVGSQEAESVIAGARLPVEATLDLMDLMSGGRIGPYLSSMSQMAENLGLLVSTFSDKKRFKALIDVIDQINPLVNNLNNMSKNVVVLTDQLNYKRRMGRLISTLATLTDEVNKHMPALANEGPVVVGQMAKSLENLATLTEELKKTLPALSKVAPDLPFAATRMIEAVNEAVVTLKAMQKSWFMSGNVEEVKEEEAKAKLRLKERQSGSRSPASDSEGP